MTTAEIRKIFHTISNELHKITITIGSAIKTVEMNERNSEEEAVKKNEVANLIKALSYVEEVALKAGDDLESLKEGISKKFKVDLYDTNK